MLRHWTWSHINLINIGQKPSLVLAQKGINEGFYSREKCHISTLIRLIGMQVILKLSCSCCDENSMQTAHGTRNMYSKAVLRAAISGAHENAAWHYTFPHAVKPRWKAFWSHHVTRVIESHLLPDWYLHSKRCTNQGPQGLLLGHWWSALGHDCHPQTCPHPLLVPE